jgi:hypothetical protein
MTPPGGNNRSEGELFSRKNNKEKAKQKTSQAQTCEVKIL